MPGAQYNAMNGARRRPWLSGPATKVTLLRGLLVVGCALVVLALVMDGQSRSWWLLALAVPALGLDAVDGAVARYTGTVSPQGARLDLETDAAMVLVLSVPVAATVGWWVLLVGLLRYLFVVGSWIRPRWRQELPFSQFRRVAAGTVGVALCIALVPVVPVGAAAVVSGSALILLACSFVRDVLFLERRG